MTELIILTIANDAESEFELASHEWMAYEAGLTHGQLVALRQRDEPELEDEVERIAWRTTRRLVESGDLNDEDYEAAVSTLGDRGLVELTTLVGFYRLVALQLEVFRISGDAYGGPRLPDPA